MKKQMKTRKKLKTDSAKLSRCELQNLPQKTNINDVSMSNACRNNEPRVCQIAIPEEPAMNAFSDHETMSLRIPDQNFLTTGSNCSVFKHDCDSHRLLFEVMEKESIAENDEYNQSSTRKRKTVHAEQEIHEKGHRKQKKSIHRRYFKSDNAENSENKCTNSRIEYCPIYFPTKLPLKSSVAKDNSNDQSSPRSELFSCSQESDESVDLLGNNAMAKIISQGQGVCHGTYVHGSSMCISNQIKLSNSNDSSPNVKNSSSTSNHCENDKNEFNDGNLESIDSQETIRDYDIPKRIYHNPRELLTSGSYDNEVDFRSLSPISYRDNGETDAKSSRNLSRESFDGPRQTTRSLKTYPKSPIPLKTPARDSCSSTESTPYTESPIIYFPKKSTSNSSMDSKNGMTENAQKKLFESDSEQDDICVEKIPIDKSMYSRHSKKSVSNSQSSILDSPIIYFPKKTVSRSPLFLEERDRVNEHLTASSICKLSGSEPDIDENILENISSDGTQYLQDKENLYSEDECLNCTPVEHAHDGPILDLSISAIEPFKSGDVDEVLLKDNEFEIELNGNEENMPLDISKYPLTTNKDSLHVTEGCPDSQINLPYKLIDTRPKKILNFAMESESLNNAMSFAYSSIDVCKDTNPANGEQNGLENCEISAIFECQNSDLSGCDIFVDEISDKDKNVAINIETIQTNDKYSSQFHEKFPPKLTQPEAVHSSQLVFASKEINLKVDKTFLSDVQIEQKVTCSEIAVFSQKNNCTLVTPNMARAQQFLPHGSNAPLKLHSADFIWKDQKSYMQQEISCGNLVKEAVETGYETRSTTLKSDYVEDSSLKHINSLVENKSESTMNTPWTSSVTFTTGKNKKIHVSDKAMMEAQRRMNKLIAKDTSSAHNSFQCVKNRNQFKTPQQIRVSNENYTTPRIKGFSNVGPSECTTVEYENRNHSIIKTTQKSGKENVSKEFDKENARKNSEFEPKNQHKSYTHQSGMERNKKFGERFDAVSSELLSEISDRSTTGAEIQIQEMSNTKMDTTSFEFPSPAPSFLVRNYFEDLNNHSSSIADSLSAKNCIDDIIMDEKKFETSIRPNLYATKIHSNDISISEKSSAESAFSLFSTGKGKKISISADAMDAAQKRLKLDTSYPLNYYDNGKKDFVGIARNKFFKEGISELSFENIAKTDVSRNDMALQANFSNKDEVVPINHFNGKCKQKVVSELTLEETSRSLDLTSNSNTKHCTLIETSSKKNVSNTILGCFSTGKGKDIYVSESAMEEATRRLQSNLGLSPKRSRQNDSVDKEQSILSCFSTGKGKKVSISESAIEEATRRLQSNQGLSPKRSMQKERSKAILGCFSTGKGKDISVSESAMEEATRRLQSNLGLSPKRSRQNDSVDKEQSILSCFSTGKGKKVSISESAIEEATRRLQSNVESIYKTDIHLKSKFDLNESLEMEIDSKPAAFSFSTGKGIKKPVSAAALAEAKKRLDLYSSNSVKPKNSWTGPNSLSKIKSNLPSNSELNARQFDIESPSVQLEISFPSVEIIAPLAFEPMSTHSCTKENQNVMRSVVKKPLRSLGCPLPPKCRLNLECSGPLWQSTAIYDYLIENGARPELISISWVTNHTFWIRWKLESMEKSWPEKLRGYFSMSRILQQLQHRYEIELLKGKKAFLRRVLQGDLSSELPCILCVVSLSPPFAVLTDGWYSIDAALDPGLAFYVTKKTIQVGCKLFISGGILAAGTGGKGGGSGVDPLELMEMREKGELPLGVGPVLKLSINSTRKARWDSRLGLVDPATNTKIYLKVPLCTVISDGGVISAVDVIVLRRYPIQFLENSSSTNSSASDGASVIQTQVLSELEEEGMAAIHALHLNSIVESSELQIQTETEYEIALDRPKIYSDMIAAGDPEFYFQSLNAEEQEEIKKWLNTEHNLTSVIRQRIISKKLMDAPSRKSRPFIVALVSCCCRVHPCHSSRTAYFRVFGPSEEVINKLREGSHITLQKVGTREGRGESSLLLESTRKSCLTVQGYPGAPKLLEAAGYTPRMCSKLGDIMGSMSGMTESVFPYSKGGIDIVGVTLQVVQQDNGHETSTNKTLKRYLVFVIDTSQCILCLERSILVDLIPHNRIISSQAFSSFAFQNVAIDGYREEAGMLLGHWTDYSEAISNNSRVPSHLIAPLNFLRDWSKSEQGKRVLCRAKDRISNRFL